MFNLRKFIKKGFLDSVGKLPDYQIILNASGWFDKGVLTEDDLAEIQSAIDAKNAPATPAADETPAQSAIVPDAPATDTGGGVAP